MVLHGIGRNAAKLAEAPLKALAAWTANPEGFYLHQGKTPPEQPSWKTVAEMMIAARTDE